MRCISSPPTMRVIKKEEKEAQIRDLISTHVRTCAPATGSVFHLVVRSHESPVVRALTALAAELTEARCSIEVVVALPGADNAVIWPAELADLSACRTLDDPRLLDAHEQLWLDAETVWIGDCMRREPDKRDAYECYGRGCRTTAAGVLASFDKFWGKAARANHAPDVKVSKPVAAEADPVMVGVPGNEPPTPPTAMTRH